jgi:23S rRNA (pseudouridine1915-N3)-methyltransferase
VLASIKYCTRLRASGGVKLVELKAAPQEKESAVLLACSEGMFRVVLDEQGDRSPAAGQLSGWEQGRVKQVAFLIGGADGHGRRASQGRLVLGPGKITFQHSLPWWCCSKTYGRERLTPAPRITATEPLKVSLSGRGSC